MAFSAGIIANRESFEIRERGRAYQSQVKIAHTEPGAILAKVQGRNLYITNIWKEDDDYFDDCDCPYGPTCKHTIALAYVIEKDPKLRMILDSEVTDAPDTSTVTKNTGKEPVMSWLKNLQNAPSTQINSPQQKKTEGIYYQLLVDFEKGWNGKRKSEENFLAVQVGKYNTSKSYGTRFANAQDAGAMLKRNSSYFTDLDRKILQIIVYCKSNHYYYSYDNYNLIRLDSFALSELYFLWQQCPFVLSENNTPIHFYPRSVRFMLESKTDEKGLRWQAVLYDNNTRINQETIRIIFSYAQPFLLTKNDTLYQLTNAYNTATLLRALTAPIISPDELKNPEIIAALIHSAKYAPLILPKTWEDNAKIQQGTPQLLVDTEQSPWQVTLYFSYGNQKFTATDPQQMYSQENAEGVIYKRNIAEEKQILENIKRIFSLPEINGSSFKLSTNQQTIFFTEIIYQIPPEWDVLLNKEDSRIERSKQKITIEQTSGIDWLEISGNVQFDNETIALFAILEEINLNQPLIKINNNTVLLDKQTKSTLLTLKRLYDPDKKSLKLHKTHVGLAESLSEIIDYKKLHISWQKSLNALRVFKRISPKKLPDTFTAKLRDYQQEGVNWLHFLQEFSFGGILADDMGLGKTIQALAVLTSVHKDSNILPSLIVAPTTVVYNWQAEIKKFSPALSAYLHIGKNRQIPKKHIDLIITSYPLLLRDKESLTKLQFRYLILDEAQYIKNHAAKTTQAAREIQALHKLSLTGTPVENNLVELWSQFSLLNPGLFGSKEDFINRFTKPIERNDPQAKKHLLQLIKPFLLRRTKGEVIRELPPKTEQTIWVAMEENQRKLYELFKSYYQAKLSSLIKKQGIEKSQVQILEALLRLRQICCHPKLLKLDKKITFQNLPSQLRIVEESAKLEAVIELIKTALAEQHKILLFSQFVEMLKLIEQALQKMNVPYLLLTGQSKNRQELIKNFQETNIYPVFLLSLKAGGTGLNLTAADYVIHYDPWWNPAVENQATDRAHRIGQHKTVSVYKFLVKDSIEEKIQELQKKKKGLIESILNGTTGNKKLTRDDIVFLFS